MPTYPEPQLTWNSIVNATIKRWAMHVESINPPQIVSLVEKDKEYNMWLSFKNISQLELEYENVEIRLIGKPNQIDFIQPHGAIDYDGNPRIHLQTGYLGAGQIRGWMLRIKARKTMATKSLKFSTGIYGHLVPQGLYWTTIGPTL